MADAERMVTSSMKGLLERWRSWSHYLYGFENGSW